MKKLLLGLGALTAVITPVATVVACGNTTPPTKDDGRVDKTMTIDLTGIKKTDTLELIKLRDQYDQYANLLTERSGSVTLIMKNNGESYSYEAAWDPGKCVAPDGRWEHLVVMLEDLTGKPGIADLILDE